MKPEGLSSESLLAAYHSIAKFCHQDFAITAQRIPNLLSRMGPAPVLQTKSFLSFGVFRHSSHASSGLQYFPSTILQRWQLQLEASANPDDLDKDPTRVDVEDFNLDSRDGILRPTLVPLTAFQILQIAVS
jgi:hypothetical protein